MLKVVFSNSFVKDLKRAKSRNLDIEKLNFIISRLANELPLDRKFKDHKLVGKNKDYRECHIQPDWLLVYQIKKDELQLILIRTGTHSDLF